jgi:hypothetical protein
VSQATTIDGIRPNGADSATSLGGHQSSSLTYYRAKSRHALSVYMVALSLLLMASPGCSFSADAPPVFSQAVREAAIQYVRSLPDDQKIMVWPSRLRSYKVWSGDPQLSRVIDDYFKNRGAPVEAEPNDVFSNITIGIASSSEPTVQEILRGLSGSSYANEFAGLATGRPGCSGKLEFDRNTWIDSGLGLIVEPQSNSASTTVSCTTALLDYLNGFPMRDNVFVFDDAVPGTDVRNAVMWAFRECSEQRGPAEAHVERTRDGVAPLPTKNCALDYLSK